MKSILRVFTNEFRRQGRRGAYLFMSIGIPLIAIMIFYGIQIYQQIKQNTPEDTNISDDRSGFDDIVRPAGVVDLSGVVQKPSLLDKFIGSSTLKYYDSEEAAQAAMEKGEIGSYYLVEKDYLQTGQVKLYVDRFSIANLSSSGLRKMLVDSLTAKQDIDPNVIKRLQASPVYISHTISDTGSRQTTSGNTSFWLAYVFSLVLIFTSFITSGYLMQSIVEEKENRMIEILLSSLRPLDLLVGKILALGLLGLIQMLLWGAALIYIMWRLPQVPGLTTETLGLTMPSAGQLIVLIIYFLLGYLLVSTIYASIGALSTNMREGPQMAALVTMPMAIPMYALSIITAAPAGAVAVGLSLFPLTAPLTMVSRIAISDVPLHELLLSMGLMGLTILFAMWLAGRLFRVNTLLAGQMPKLRDIPKLIAAK